MEGENEVDEEYKDGLYEINFEKGERTELARFTVSDLSTEEHQIVKGLKRGIDKVSPHILPNSSF